MPKENEQQDKYLFALSAIDIPKVEEGKRRTFAGTAYTGGRVDGHWYWGRTGVVFDLEGIEIATPTPLLEEHFSANRIGVVKQVSTTAGIDVSGHFLKNPKALEIIQDSDDEFPFQMSMFIDPGSIEEVLQGQTVNVNGQSFTGPIAIFRNNRIREFTICSTGADRNTSIKAFSGKPNTIQQEDTNVTELEQTKAAQKQAETERDNALAELKQFKATKRTEDIAALQTELNTAFSAEDMKTYSEMDDSMFGFAAKQLRQFSTKPPENQNQQQQQNSTVPPHLAHLFSHQATRGDQNQFNAGHNQGSALDQAFSKFAAAQEVK